MKLHRNLFVAAFALLLAAAPAAQAIVQQELSEEEYQAMMETFKPLEVTGDAIPWHVFKQTKEIEECGKDDEGFDYCIIRPEYSEDVKALDGKEATLTGYMFPLDDAEKQKNFLIGPYPLSCPFHYHAGPAQSVEVLADEGVEFSYEPVTIKGIMRIRFNEETEVFFYLENAKP
jgi:hypothetical protein